MSEHARVLPGRPALPRPAALGLAAVATVVLLNLLIGSLATSAPSGPASSSYASAPRGLAAYADLLRASGHGVMRLRGPLAGATLPVGATLVLLQPGRFETAGAAAVGRFLDRGGRLVAGGEGSARWLERLLAAPPRRSPRGPRSARPLVPTGKAGGAGRVVLAGEGRWWDAGSALPVLAGDRGAVLAVAHRGAGRLVLLADPSPLQNRLLARARNAAFALDLAGPRGRPVLFAEGVHGYGTATGYAALPLRVKAAIAGLALAGIVLVAARFRRLGPADLPAETQVPPRQAYVEAVGGLLARSRGREDAAGPLREAARRALVEASGGGDEQQLRRRGAALGVTEADLDAVLSGRGGPVPAARALVRVRASGDRR